MINWDFETEKDGVKKVKKKNRRNDSRNVIELSLSFFQFISCQSTVTYALIQIIYIHNDRIYTEDTYSTNIRYSPVREYISLSFVLFSAQASSLFVSRSGRERGSLSRPTRHPGISFLVLSSPPS